MTSECINSTASLQKSVSISNIIFLILDLIVAILTIAGNSIFMITLIKNKKLHTPSNMLLGALCFSDLLVGYLLQPMYLGFYFKVELQVTTPKEMSPIRDKIYTVGTITVALSFLFAAIISVDRYVAICHPYRYHASASCKTHIWIAILSSMAWTIVPIICHVIDEQVILAGITLLIIIIGISSILFSYYKIYSVIKRQNNSVHTLGTIERKNGLPEGKDGPHERKEGLHDRQEGQLEEEKRKRERDRTSMIKVIFLGQFICFAPYFMLTIYFLATSSVCLDTPAKLILDLWAVFLLLGNSFVNPIIYCFKYKVFRNSALRLICGNRYNESQSRDSMGTEMKERSRQSQA